MYKTLRADKDTYITDRVIKKVRSYSSNVGAGGTLDLFKLYGLTTTATGSWSSGSWTGQNPYTGSFLTAGTFTQSGSLLANVELSRLLIHFDLSTLKTLVTAGTIDPGNSSFNCSLQLFDVYGGQPTPNNFTVAVFPLSASFDEGLGRDVVFYGDNDVCNFLTGSSTGGPWIMSGCFSGSGASTICDYITASANVLGAANLKASQLFKTGEEDLSIDVTTIVSATLAGLLPDQGFRISLDAPLENDQHTYFVKRFSSRSAYNTDKRPKLIIKFDDSIQDDSTSLYFDSPSYLFLYNYIRQAPANILSASSAVTGSNCMLLKLETPVSGGILDLFFTGSQVFAGKNPVVGIYSASVNVPVSNALLAAQLAASGSVTFTPIWGSFDGTLAYVTGSQVVAYPPQRGSKTIDPKRFVVTVIGLQESYFTTDTTALRVNIFDYTSPQVMVVKTPVELPGVSVRDVHYQVRDHETGLILIPFDTVYNSTRLSSDAGGMYFHVDMSNMTANHTYAFDILIVTGNNRQVYKAASPTFKVSDLT